MPSPSGCRISVEKFTYNLMGVPLCVICLFSHVAFNILSLIFARLITVSVDVFFLGFILPGTLCTSWTWLTIIFPMLRKFSAIISSNIFLSPFSLSYPSGTSIMQMFMCLMLWQRFLRVSSFLFILFSMFCFVGVISTILSYSQLSVLLPQLFC